MEAANLAVTHVNKRGLWGGYQLKLYTNDTRVSKSFKINKALAVSLDATPLTKRNV